MLAELDSRISGARKGRDTRYDHVENCNTIHCDILASIFLKSISTDIQSVNRKKDFLQKLRSFIINQHVRKQILHECQCSSNIHQLLHWRHVIFINDKKMQFSFMEKISQIIDDGSLFYACQHCAS